MNNVSAHVWIAYLATLGCALATVAYCVVRPNSDASQQFMFQIANSMISGAVGAFTMSKVGPTSIPANFVPPVNPQQPEGPAETK